MLHRVAGVASLVVVLLAVACAGSANPHGDAVANANETSSSQMDTAACQDLSSQAVDTLTNAAMSVPQCAADSDCRPIDVPPDCWSSCVSFVGDDDVRKAIASQAGTVAGLCDRFRQKGCVVSEGGCPAEIKNFTCQMSKCVAGASNPATAASCEDLSARALSLLLSAATSVGQCTVPSDCKDIPIPGDCLSSCVNVVGNDDVRNAITSKTDDIVSVCNEFHEKSCTVSEGGCPAQSKSYGCQMSKCTRE